ncbi:glycosyltransferase [Patescibacteria group bacterium]|nr:glycosyltransferase [Patescibacteria group bacterium]
MINYNYAQYLERALESVVNQTSLPYEYLIIDDKSTDNSAEIIKKYEKKFSFIKFHQNEHNSGVHHNINLGLTLASGEYIHFFSPDDYLAPNFYEESSKLLIKYPMAGLVCSIAVFVKQNEEFDSEFIHPESNIPEYVSAENISLISQKGFFIPGHTSIMKKQYLLEIGGFPKELKWHCDWFSLYILAFRYGFCYVHKRLAFLRIHPNSYSVSRNIWKEQKKVLTAFFALIQKTNFLDIKDKFFESDAVFTLPLIDIYFLTHPKLFFIILKRIGFSFLKKIFQRKFLIDLLKNLLRPFLGSTYKFIKRKYFLKN